MTLFVSSKGIERDLDIDVDKVCAYEDQHPEWNLVDLILRLHSKPRFTDMALLAYFLGFDSLKDYIEEGFCLKDLLEAAEKASVLGFMISGMQEEPEEDAEPEETDV